VIVSISSNPAANTHNTRALMNPFHLPSSPPTSKMPAPTHLTHPPVHEDSIP
jgi:hypothetical protein